MSVYTWWKEKKFSETVKTPGRPLNILHP